MPLALIWWPRRSFISAGIYGVLHLLFQLATEYDLIETSPVRPKLHRPDLPKVEKLVLSPDQIREITARLDDQERLFVLLLGITSLRMGEALALRWLNFNQVRCEISITHSLYRDQLKQPKTERSKAVLRLHPAVVGMLADHRQQSAFQADGDFIFCREDGGPLSSLKVRRHLYSTMDSAGICHEKSTHGFHLFRHTAGSLLYDWEGDIKQVQVILRHANLSTTADIYVHPGESVGSEASDVLAKAVLGESCDKIASQIAKMMS